MKPITGIALSTTLVFGLGYMVGCYVPTPSQTTVKTHAQAETFQTVTFYVDGMV